MTLEPKKYCADRIYEFWHAYHKEAESLADWHQDGTEMKNDAKAGGLLIKFGETWGDGEFENDSDLSDKSYFAALGYVSRKLRKKCLDYLKHHRVNGDDEPVLDANGKPIVIDAGGEELTDPEAAQQRAKECIVYLEQIFSGELAKLDEIDNETERCRDYGEERFGKDSYLPVLHRLMLIESDCFTFQRNFLRTGDPNDMGLVSSL